MVAWRDMTCVMLMHIWPQTAATPDTRNAQHSTELCCALIMMMNDDAMHLERRRSMPKHAGRKQQTPSQTKRRVLKKRLVAHIQYTT